jgi:hypothetical protein
MQVMAISVLIAASIAFSAYVWTRIVTRKP